MGCSNCNSCAFSEKRGFGTSSVFNWLADIDQIESEGTKNLVEVRFKKNRKGYFENTNNLELNQGDIVAVEANTGHDIGKVTLLGELVHHQIRRKKINTETDPVHQIYRLANERDLNKWEESISLEESTIKKAKKIIENHKINMKLVDVEFQSDKSKAIFYYTAEKRVDFRELIKEYSRVFGIRIEMKQIGVRQESAMLGGIGSCGRELCCSTWMTKLPKVSTSSARYQQLSINPQKISGQCGKLKCCLNFELDGYLDGLNNFPNTKKILKTKKGEAKQIKIDVFKKRLWYMYKNQPGSLHEISLKNVIKIINQNESKKIPASLEEFEETIKISKNTYQNVFENQDISRFDKSKKN